MRIAIVTGEYPPLEGGVGDFTRELGRALYALDHEIHILTSGETKEAAREDGMTIYRQVRDWGWGTHAQITRWANGVAPDVLNIQYQAAAYQMKGTINLYPRWQQRHLSFPIVVTFHDLMPPYIFPKAGPLRHWTVLQLACYSQGVIVTNEEDYTKLSSEEEDEALPPIRLIPIGSNIAPCPPEDYERDTWRTSVGLEPDDLVLGFFGFLNRSKGVETLLEAVKRLADAELPVHLLFIGGRTGSSDFTNIAYAREIDAYIDTLGIAECVHRTGFTHPAEVSAALLSADLCVLPYRDGASLRRGTLHACLAHGRPIVTTEPQTPIEQLVDGETVLFVPPEDSAALAEAIRWLWHKPKVRTSLGTNAGRLAEEFSWNRIAMRTAQFFKSLR